MIELIKHLGEPVAVVGDTWRASSPCRPALQPPQTLSSSESALPLLVTGECNSGDDSGYPEETSNSLRLTQYRANAGISILNKGTCIAIKVNTLLWIEEHVLTSIDLEG